MTSEKKWECTFPNLQGVCTVAKKLKKFLALAEVQKSSLGSRQVVLPVREIYSQPEEQAGIQILTTADTHIGFT